MEIKVGDRFTTNKGGDVVVVEYVNTKNMTVEFDDPVQSRPRKCEAFFEVVLPYDQFCGPKSWVSSWRRFDVIAILGS